MQEDAREGEDRREQTDSRERQGGEEMHGEMWLEGRDEEGEDEVDGGLEILGEESGEVD